MSIKLKNTLGKDLFVYDERYQTNPEMYPSLIETSGTSKYVILDGKYTTTFIKELNYVPTTCSVYLKIKFNDSFYNDGCGILGFGDNQDYIKNNMWGLVTSKDSNTGNLKFYLIISDGSLSYDKPFSFIINKNTLTTNTFHDLVLTQTTTQAKLYIDGNLVSQIHFLYI